MLEASTFMALIAAPPAASLWKDSRGQNAGDTWKEWLKNTS